MGSMQKEMYFDLPLFHDFPGDSLLLLERVLVDVPITEGQIVFAQGQPALNLFILARGEVVIYYKPYDGPSITVARIQPGGVFGWSAALGRDCYSSTAVASQNSDALRINGYNLYQFCESNPEIGQILLERLASVIAERLQSTHAEILAILVRGLDNYAQSRREPTP